MIANSRECSNWRWAMPFAEVLPLSRGRHTRQTQNATFPTPRRPPWAVRASNAELVLNLRWIFQPPQAGPQIAGLACACLFSSSISWTGTAASMPHLRFWDFEAKAHHAFCRNSIYLSDLTYSSFLNLTEPNATSGREMAASCAWKYAENVRHISAFQTPTLVWPSKVYPKKCGFTVFHPFKSSCLLWGSPTAFVSSPNKTPKGNRAHPLTLSTPVSS